MRWIFPSGKYFAFNPNDGKPYWKESNIECYGNLKQRLPYLTVNYYDWNLDFTESLANYKRLRADRWYSKKGNWDKESARQDYAEVVGATTKLEPGLLNNYTWLHIMNPVLDSEFDIDVFHVYIDSAIALERDLNYHQAKACLFALQNKFDEAIKELDLGLALQNDQNEKRDKAKRHRDCFVRNEVCREID